MSIRPDTLGRKWQRTRLGYFCEVVSLWLVRALYPRSAKARGFFTDFSLGFLGLYYEPSAAQVGGFLYYDKKY